MAVAQDILPAEQHLELGVLEVGLDGAQALPRVLLQVAQAGVEGRAAPAFHGMVAALVHVIQHAQKILDRHAGSDQRLLRVPQDGLGDVH